jgi:hypothetical protein
MASLYLRKTLSGFVPNDEASAELWRRYKQGGVYRADVVKPRSYQHHKLAFALLNLTFDNQDRYTDFETFRKAVALAAGHVEELVTLEGEIVRLPASLSFDSLDEIEFTRVFGAMMTVCANLLHDMGRDELAAEVSVYANEHYGAAA